MSNEIKKACPELVMFGATYPDGGCVNGYMWDLDSYEDGFGFIQGGEIPCPNCNKAEYDKYCKDDE